MKKIVSLLISFALCLSFCACGGGKKKAFSISKQAYSDINAAYELTEEFGSDIYEAWYLGIFEDDEVLDGGCKYLASELNLSEDEIKEGVVYFSISIIDNATWDSVTDEQKQQIRDYADNVFLLFKDDLYSACVQIISDAYIANGKADQIQEYLDSAKTQMKELSDKYSDYEHYPNLKGYYTTTNAFFDFCKNPSGSFEQVKGTINDYKNSARNYNNDLSYVFDE